jgi:hypothetical protein
MIPSRELVVAAGEFSPECIHKKSDDISGQMKKKDGDHSVLTFGVGGPLISLMPRA